VTPQVQLSPMSCEITRAEGVGFEPTMTLPRHSGFQDRRTRPLCEPSTCKFAGFGPIVTAG
jgi:hypothetical protein